MDNKVKEEGGQDFNKKLQFINCNNIIKQSTSLQKFWVLKHWTFNQESILSMKYLLPSIHFPPSSHLLPDKNQYHQNAVQLSSRLLILLKSKTKWIHLSFKFKKTKLWAALFYLGSANQNPMLPWKPSCLLAK